MALYQCTKFHIITINTDAPDKLLIAKIKKGSKSVNTGDRVMVLAFCYSPHGPLSVYLVSLNNLKYF